MRRPSSKQYVRELQHRISRLEALLPKGAIDGLSPPDNCKTGSDPQDPGPLDSGSGFDTEHDAVLTAPVNPVSRADATLSLTFGSPSKASFVGGSSPREGTENLNPIKNSKESESANVQGAQLERGTAFDVTDHPVYRRLFHPVSRFSADMPMTVLSPTNMSFAGPVYLQDPEAGTKGDEGRMMTHFASDLALPSVSDQDTAESYAASSLRTKPASKPRSEALLDLLYQTNGRFKVNGGGEIHFFGSSSDYYATSFMNEADPTSESRMWSNALSGFSAMQESLLSQFWAHPAPYLRLLDQEAFMEGLKNGVRTPYYSPLLLTTVFLRSIRFCDSPLARRLAPELLERAQEQLAEESEDPGSTTVISLLMLSNYVSSQSRGGLGWLYTGKSSTISGRVHSLTIYKGVAARMVFELGLHQDCTDLRKLGYVTKKQCEERKRVFWMAFVNDWYVLASSHKLWADSDIGSLWAVYFGRPAAIKLSEITVPLLSPMDDSFDTALLAAWVELCKIQGAVAELCNITTRRSHAEEGTIQQLTTCDRMLRQWDLDLSDHLRWQAMDLSDRGPSLCVLQMMYCTTMITLHRPLAGFGKASPPLRHAASAFGSVDSANTATSREICRNFAVQGATLLDQFHRVYGPKHASTLMIRITFVVATTLVLQILATEEYLDTPCSEERDRLKPCVTFLDNLASQFPIGIQAARTLHTLLQHCGIENSADESSAKAPIQKSQGAEVDLFDDDWITFLPTYNDRVGLDGQAFFNGVDAFATA